LDTCSNDPRYKETEEFSHGLEENYKGIYAKIDGLLADCTDIFKAAVDNPADRPAVYKWFDYYSEVSQADNDFAERLQIIEISQKETEDGIDRTILDVRLPVRGGADDTSEGQVLYVFRAVKFALFRIEFNKLDDGGLSFCSMVKESGLSEVAIAKMVEWCSINKPAIYLSLSRMFLENGMIDHSKYMLGMAKNVG